MAISRKIRDRSDLIKSLLLDNEPGPLRDGAGWREHDRAGAKPIYDRYANTPQWETIRDKVSNKLNIIPSGDPDDTGASSVRPNWPGTSASRWAS